MTNIIQFHPYVEYKTKRNLKKKNNQNKNRLTDVDNRLVATREKRGGGEDRMVKGDGSYWTIVWL